MCAYKDRGLLGFQSVEFGAAHAFSPGGRPLECPLRGRGDVPFSPSLW